MTDDSRDKLISEALGVLLLALTGLLFISLATYSPNDLNTKAQIVNYAGLVGALIAHGLFAAIGITAYLIPLFSLSFAIGCFRMRKLKFSRLSLAGWLLLFLACCSLTATYFTTPLTIAGIPFDSPGGVVGNFVSHTLLLPYLNTGGTYLIIITLLIISLMLSTGLSWAKVFSQLEKLSANILNLRDRDTEKVSSPKRRKKRPEAKTKSKADSKDAGTPPIITSHRNRKHNIAEINDLEIPSPNCDSSDPYQYPHLGLLDKPKSYDHHEDMRDLHENSDILVAKLKDFGVEGRVVQIHPGPVITRYEFEPAPGVKINKITNLADDLALAMRARAVRVVAPIPGKAVVGIEIPNKKRETICLSEIISSEKFQQADSKLTLALGKDISGAPYVTNLAKMPHLLIAGATGSGKSVTLNAVICSLLYKASHKEVRLLMLDPKMLELGIYNGIPHLLVPVVTDAKKAAQVLKWATNQMEERYQLLAKYGVRNIDQYNQLLTQSIDTLADQETDESTLPYIVIIIDEFADLMMVAPRDVEALITRLAQMARAVGIHLIIATQRPSVDVITGLIKANFPSRISFRVSSKIDSRTIIDTIGSEKLLGRGDMLFIPPGTADLERIHGALVTEKEVNRVVKFLKGRAEPQYDESILIADDDESSSQKGDKDDYDEFYDKAAEFVMQRGEASISKIQRQFRIGYNRAARIVEIMERDGLVGPSEGGKPRKVLVNRNYEV
jgi:S-DNA-T family DNA segregation ATPase FtsK/SpoIIIE